jgi:hypothetical protein
MLQTGEEFWRFESASLHVWRLAHDAFDPVCNA